MSEARKPTPFRSPAIPDKLYFRIGEVARLVGVETHTLRFWESEFPQLKVGKGGTGQRLYRRRDVETLLEIKHLLYEQGYTIPGARQHLQCRPRRSEPATLPFPGSPPESTPTHREDRLALLRTQLQDLRELLNSGSGGATQTTEAGAGTAPLAKGSRGLHLASRPVRQKLAQEDSDSPGLFRHTQD